MLRLKVYWRVQRLSSRAWISQPSVVDLGRPTARRASASPIPRRSRSSSRLPRKAGSTYGAKFLVDMGFPLDKVATEVPSYDWVYSNVHVEAYLK